MNKVIIAFILLFIHSLSYSQNQYNLKNVTVIENGSTCKVDKSDPKNIVVCDWLNGLKECRDEFCWMTHFAQDSYTYEGIAIHAISAHVAWVKELTIYDFKGKVVEAKYDSLTNFETLLKINLNKSKKSLSNSNRFIYISKENGIPYIFMDGWGWRKPKNADERLDKIN